MTIGIIGLGRMGMQIARRLHKNKFKVIAYNRSTKPLLDFKKHGGLVANSVPELIEMLPKPRIIWVMLPSGHVVGNITEDFLLGANGLSDLLSKNDMVIDGGNSFYEDTIRRAKVFYKKNINFLDCGTSGGIWGEKNGFSLMIGGDAKVFKKIESLFKTLAAGNGTSYGLMGQAGAGHFVKMVHNGIEYGMMEAIAEGFAILQKSKFHPDLAKVAKVWEQGSVVSSWLVELARDIFEKENFNKISGYIAHTGEGLWTIKIAKKLGVDARIIAESFQIRQESEQKQNQNKFSNKIVSLLRNRFGGHEVKRK